MEFESTGAPASAFDIARIGSRLTSLLLLGRLLTLLPMLPIDLSVLQSPDTAGPFFSKAGAIASLASIVLLALAIVILWTYADRVARGLVAGVAFEDRVESETRTLADAFATGAGWILILYSLDGVAYIIARLMSEETSPRLLDRAGPCLAFLIGLALVIARGRLTRLFGSRLPPGY